MCVLRVGQNYTDCLSKFLILLPPLTTATFVELAISGTYAPFISRTNLTWIIIRTLCVCNVSNVQSVIGNQQQKLHQTNKQACTQSGRIYHLKGKPNYVNVRSQSHNRPQKSVSLYFAVVAVVVVVVVPQRGVTSECSHDMATNHWNRIN